MKKLLQRIAQWNLPTFTFPLALLGLCLVSYALMIPWLGFYWDDWPFIWISQKLGSAALTDYFATKRPVLGLLYQVTTPLVGNVPWRWHVFGLLWRWLNAVSLWWVLRLVWLHRTEIAAWAAALFVLYPGFDQQYIPIAYAHYFITMTAFFLSFAFMLLALRNPHKKLPYTLLAVAFSLINLLTTEYFFVLDLLRPLLIWIVLRDSVPDRRARLRHTLLTWLPYLLLFAVPALWRVFFFQYQTYSYDLQLLEDLQSNPALAVQQFVEKFFYDIRLTSLGAWGKAFTLPTVEALGKRNLLRYALLVGGSALGLWGFFLLFRPESDAPLSEQRSTSLQALGVGLVGIFLAGWPFWITRLPIALAFPNSRFTLPFMLGVSLALAALLQLLPVWRWLKIALLAVALGFAVGLQFTIALNYRVQWSWHTAMFWQMNWRMPQIEKGTALAGNYIPGMLYSDNSLSAPLNYIYSPDNLSRSMDYMFYFPELRLGRQIPAWETGHAIKHDYLAAVFHGSTSQMIVVYHKAPACLRVLEADLDPFNLMLPEEMRQAAVISSTAPILAVPDEQAAHLPAEIYGSEPARGWCYYFEKADLARQQGDWAAAADLGEQALAAGLHFEDPAELFVFIESAAHTGDWQRALELTDQANQKALEDGVYRLQPALLRLWQRMAAQTENSIEKDEALQQASQLLGETIIPLTQPTSEGT